MAKTVVATRPRQCLVGCVDTSLSVTSAQSALISTQVYATYDGVFSAAARYRAALAMSPQSSCFRFTTEPRRSGDRSVRVFRCGFFLFAHLFLDHVCQCSRRCKGS